MCLLKDCYETACMYGEKSPLSNRRIAHYVDCEQWVFSRSQLKPTLSIVKEIKAESTLVDNGTVPFVCYSNQHFYTHF